MFEKYNKCIVNEAYEFPYDIYLDSATDKLIVGIALTAPERVEFAKQFPEELQEIMNNDLQITSLRFVDSSGNKIKLLKKFKRILNIAYNTYSGRLKNYDVLITFQK